MRTRVSRLGLVGESDKRSEKASGRGLVLACWACWAVLISVLHGLHVVMLQRYNVIACVAR